MTDSEFSVSIPRLSTERLLLREFRRGDFEAFGSYYSDDVAMAFLGGVVDRRTAWRLFSAGAGGWVLNGAGWWAIELRSTGELVGQVGAFFREHQFVPSGVEELELGWTVARSHWRQGIAKEAMTAVLAHVLERHSGHPVIAHIDPSNVASIAVSRALGMTYDRDIDFYGHPCARYVLDRARSERGDGAAARSPIDSGNPGAL